jgi:hypothetical protein
VLYEVYVFNDGFQYGCEVCVGRGKYCDKKHDAFVATRENNDVNWYEAILVESLTTL